MHYREKEIRLASADENKPGKEYSSMASKPSNIRWIRTGSQPYWKIINSIVLQTISYK